MIIFLIITLATMLTVLNMNDTQKRRASVHLHVNHVTLYRVR